MVHQMATLEGAYTKDAPSDLRLKTAEAVEAEFDKDCTSALLPSLRRQYLESGGVVVVGLNLPPKFDKLSELDVHKLNVREYNNGLISLCQPDKNRMSLTPHFDPETGYTDKLLAAPLRDLRAIVKQNFLHRKSSTCAFSLLYSQNFSTQRLHMSISPWTVDRFCTLVVVAQWPDKAPTWTTSTMRVHFSWS
jgi:hypothetical protein